jgi:hypothetical protein
VTQLARKIDGASLSASDTDKSIVAVVLTEGLDLPLIAIVPTTIGNEQAATRAKVFRHCRGFLEDGSGSVRCGNMEVMSRIAFGSPCADSTGLACSKTVSVLGLV